MDILRGIKDRLWSSRVATNPVDLKSIQVDILALVQTLLNCCPKMWRHSLLLWFFVGGAPVLCLGADEIATPAVEPIVLSPLAPPDLTKHILIWKDVSPGVSIEDVAGNTAAPFEPFDPSVAYAFGIDQTLWLHFRVSKEAAPTGTAVGWTLEFPKTYINRIDFYFQDGAGAWKRQTAGLKTPYAQWPQQGLWPRFELPELGDGATSFYVRVLKQAPVPLPVRLQRTDHSDAESQEALLTAGMMLGLIALMSLLSGVLALTYRNITYAWYSLYVALSFFSACGYLGVSKRAFWPNAVDWPGLSTPLFAMAALTMQLQFCRSMFLSASPSRKWHAMTSGVMAFTVFLMLLCVSLKDTYLQLILCEISSVMCAIQMMALVVRSFKRERHIAALWLLAYFPLTVALILTLLNIITRAALTWFPENGVIYALVFEVPVLLIALHLHAKAQHARQVHGSVLATIDPLTGFVPPKRFETTLATCWKGAQRRKRDLAVAYIEVSQLAASAGQPAPPALNNPKTTARIVRMLRTAALEHDTVARLNPRVFALLMPGMPPGELLASRLARLVALSLMADSEEPPGGALRLRIVASTSRTFAGSWQELHKALQHKLKGSEGWAQRAIRFVRQEREPPPDPLDAMWKRATHASDLRRPAPAAAPDSTPAKIAARYR
jgi:GGDEF domain-containing protein